MDAFSTQAAEALLDLTQRKLTMAEAYGSLGSCDFNGEFVGCIWHFMLVPDAGSFALEQHSVSEQC